MEDFKGSPTALVADVDCTAGGESLCSEQSIGGYPTIKWGEAGDMKDYEGARSYEAMKEFASNNLGPTCGPGENLELCDAKTKAKIEGLALLSVADLEAKIQKIVDNFEVNIPIMKKAMGYVKSQSK